MLRKVLLSTTRERRVKRVRGKLAGSSLPRVTVFRSNNNFYAQLIDDQKARTLAQVGPKDGGAPKELGKKLAQKALKAKVASVKFDRGAYKYHGRVKQFAEGLREGGLKL